MALTAYLTRVQQLVINPPDSSNVVYTSSDLTSYINTARSQLAAEAECIRDFGTLAITPGTLQYAFSAYVPSAGAGTSATTGIQNVLNIKQISVQNGTGPTGLQGYSPMHNRSFIWYQRFQLNTIVPQVGLPTIWAQYGQGVSGTLWVAPGPDIGYTLQLDTVCLPIPLVNDSTAEAIPYPYTDAIPYYAAYLAYQSDQRAADADRMFQMYQTFKDRARRFSNSSVNPAGFPQYADPTVPNKQGLQGASGASGGAGGPA